MKKEAAVLCALLLMVNFASPVTWAETIEDKKAELEEVQRQMDSKDAERESNQRRINNAVEALMEARRQLAEAKRELAVVEAQQEVLEAKIHGNERALSIKQKEFDNTREIYKKRLRDIYENGQVNYLDVLLGSVDFSDFASRMYLLQRVIRQDTRLIDTLTKQKEELQARQAELEENKRQLDANHEQVVAKQELVAQKQQEQQELYEQAMADKARLDAEYEELQENSRQITAMIKQMEEAGRMAAHGHGTGQFSWPVYGEITSPFGWRIHPIWHSSIFHAGIDIGADYGDPVFAADSGTVIYAGWMGGYGNAVMIDHGGGLVTLYGHNSSLTVGVGENVAKGQTIALAGSTGNSTGPHCHFEVRVHGEVVQPLDYLP
jgi:murein DD-endopeptidase MepM/ murein hydrolase activator NlpD